MPTAPCRSSEVILAMKGASQDLFILSRPFLRLPRSPVPSSGGYNKLLASSAPVCSRTPSLHLAIPDFFDSQVKGILYVITWYTIIHCTVFKLRALISSGIFHSISAVLQDARGARTYENRALRRGAPSPLSVLAMRLPSTGSNAKHHPSQSYMCPILPVT